jgi:tetratricopeptide (TPR) repeat protein
MNIFQKSHSLEKVTSEMVSTKSDFRKVFIVSLCLVVAIIVTYVPIIHFDFVGYDDELYVTENSQVQEGFTHESLKWAFTTFHSANWHPLTWLSHMLDCELYGLNSAGHHWTNVEFHIANTLLLFFILFIMTGALWKSAFVAALFALHPLHVESVAWVSERKDVLSTFFGFLMIGAYYCYIKAPDFKNYLLVIIFLSLGLMAKPMIVTFPFLLLLLDFWPLKRFQFENIRLSQAGGKTYCYFKGSSRLILEKIPLLIPVVFSCILTFLAQKSEGAVKALGALSLTTRMATAFVSYVKYVLKAIWPSNLAVFYPYPGNTLPAWQIFGAALLIATACFLAILTSKKYSYVAVGLFWYLGTLVPVIGLVQVGDQAMADRYTYIPLIGLFIIVAWGISNLFKKCQYRKIFLGVSAMIMFSALVVTTSHQLGYWKNGITLFENTVKVTENNYLAHNNLGTAYGPVDLDKAIYHYKAALNIKTDYVVAHYNLGNILVEKGNIDEAIVHYLEAVRIKPEYAEAQNNLGTALYIKKDYEGAVSHFAKALKINPQDTGAHNNLANVLFIQGKSDEAVLHYKKAIRINPEHEKAHYNLGNIMLKQGRLKKAFTHFAEVIKIKPDYVQAYNKIGLILFKQGKFNNARIFFLKAIQIDPNYSEAHKNLEILIKTIQSDKP